MKSLLLLSICDNIAILKILYFIRTLLDLVLFIVPVGLIIFIMVDFMKNVMAGREDDMKKNLNIVIKRIIYCVVLYLVPTIVEFAINGIGNFNIEYKSCFNITLQEIEEKENEQAAKCTGEYEWDDTLYMCIKKETHTNTGSTNSSITINKNTSTNSSSISNNASSSSSNSGNYHTGVKNLIYYNQGSSPWANQKYCSGSKTVIKSGCGATSLAIITSTFTNKKYDPSYVAKWICNHGHKGGGTPWKFFTMKSMLEDFDLEVETLFAKEGKVKGNAGKKYDSIEGNAILNAVKQGKGIILHIPGHYLAVGPNQKCSSKEVYLYNVGRKSHNGCYTPKELFNKTYNYKNRCTDKGNCGWKAAFAYNGK